MVRPPVGFYPVSPEMGAASGIQHDDMNSWSHCELARRQAAALGNDTMPEEFVVGVDVGQSSNPTAICVMSRIDGPNPRTDRHFEPVEPPMQPESTTPAGDYVGSPEWFADLDEQQKRAVAGAVFPAPLALKATPRPLRYVPEPQPDGAEWFAIEREKMRFRTMLNGRDPTDAGAAAHLETIRDAHHAV
jgi:hypothetical protein